MDEYYPEARFRKRSASSYPLFFLLDSIRLGALC